MSALSIVKCRWSLKLFFLSFLVFKGSGSDAAKDSLLEAAKNGQLQNAMDYDTKLF